MRHRLDLTPLPRRARGRDTDDRYLALHPSADPARFDTPYAKLVQRLRDEGLYATPNRAPWSALLDVCLAGVALWLTANVHPAFGFLAGLGFVRVGYLQHDLFHNQWSSDPLQDERLANLLCLLGGATRTWWHERGHAPHHKQPEDAVAELTPARLPALLVLPQLRLGWALIHGEHSERALALGALALQLLVLGPVGLALFNLAVLLCEAGLEVMHHPPKVVAARGWVEAQVCNARNTRCTALGRYVMGGHDLQIEHHLLPGMPRHNLRRAQPIVQAWCRRYGMPYRETLPLPAVEAFVVAWMAEHLGAEQGVTQRAR